MSNLKAHYQHKRVIMYLFILMASFCQIAYAQCLPPTAAEITSNNATCLSNGSITVNSVSEGGTENYEFALYSHDNQNLVKPWQSSNHLPGIGRGTYILRVRKVCAPGVSQEFTKEVTVGGNYIQPSISNVTINKNSKCNDGMLTVTGQGGNGAYQFALVNSINEPEPVSNYVRTPNASGVFDNLAAGEYYVRIYDECGSFATRTATIGQLAASDPFTENTVHLEYYPCDSMTYTFSNDLSNAAYLELGVPHEKKRFWIIHPNGTLDTVDYKSFFTSPYLLGPGPKFHLSKLGDYGTGPFPGTGGVWPKNYTIGYKDECGNIFTHTYTIQKPVLEWDIIANGAGDACGFRNYFVAYRNMGTAPGFTYVRLKDAHLSLSKDGGVTWEEPAIKSGAPSSFDYVNPFELATDTTYNICLRLCGVTTCKSVTTPSLGAISVEGWESSLESCPGLTGYYVTYIDNAIFPVSVEMVSGPSGQSFTPFSYESSFSVLNAQSTMFKDLVPGSYTFKFTDACGRTTNLNIDLTHPRLQYNIQEIVSNCTSGNMEIISSSGTGYWYNSYKPEHIGPRTTIRILNLDNTEALGSYDYDIYAQVSGANYIHSISAGILHTYLEIGKTYKVRVYDKIMGDVNTSCNFAETTFTWTGGSLDLSNSLAVNCPSNPAGTIAAVATGGSGYVYSLYKDSVNPANLIAGPQTSNIFNNIPSDNYVLTVQDNCGRGTQRNISFDETSNLPISYSSSTQPCVGSTFIMHSVNIPNATYRWLKDGNLIAGETTNSLTLSQVSLADAGIYTMEVVLGDCQVAQSTFNIDPGKCNQPLPVTLISFSGRYTESAVQLSWSTTEEVNSSKFEVEKSLDGKSWKRVGEIPAQGASISLHQYHLADYYPSSGVSYYRLKMIDQDNSYAYSRVISITIKDSTKPLFLTEIFPNPATDIIRIKTSEWKEVHKLEVFDVTGRIVMHITNPTDPSIIVSSLNNGTYILRLIKQNGETALNKFIIRR